MEGKVWRPGPTVCRCCLSEGCYKDISTEYFWMGKKEVYADMLSDTFDLSIQYAPTGGPNSQSRLICEPCISRLRDATDFRRQIKECEQTFMEYLNPSTTVDIEIPVEPEKEVKTVTVKVEKPLSDDDDFGDTELLDDDDDDLDDEPLMSLASKVPKKESVDETDLIDNAKAEKRKSTTKPKATPKKAKVKEAKPSVSKAKPEKKKKAETEDPVRKNAEIIMRHTTANPFRVNDRCVLCVYCQDLFENPDEFRSHMSVEHHTFSSKVAFYNLPKSEFIKADITDLQCRVCSEKFTDIETVARHLNESHNERIEFNAKLGVMPYRLLKGALACTICFKPLPSVFHLNRHTITHFQTYVCHVCGKSYVATTGLLRHVRLKHQQYEITCRNCGKVFPNMEAKDKHHRTEKSCMLYTCTKCKERFQDHNARVKHMEAKHGLNKRTYRCDDCNMTFNSVSAYYAHFKVHHSNDYVVCKHCGQKFTSKWRLQRHLSKHNF